jgi:hypothetical protein
MKREIGSSWALQTTVNSNMKEIIRFEMIKAPIQIPNQKPTKKKPFHHHKHTKPNNPLHTHKKKHQNSSKCKEQTIYPIDLNKIDFKRSTYRKKMREREAYKVVATERLELSGEEWQQRRGRNE